MKHYISIIVLVACSLNICAEPQPQPAVTQTVFEAVAGNAAQKALNNVKTSAQEVVRQLKLKTGGDVAKANAAVKDMLAQLQEAVSVA